MADTVSIMASDDHGNATTAKVGQTWTLVGYKSGSVPLALQAKSEPVSVGDYSTLRLELNVSAMSNRGGFENGLPNAATLHVSLEHKPDDSSSWLLLHSFAPQRDLGSQLVNLSKFHPNIRASWWFSRGADVHNTVVDEVAFQWSITGDTLPETA